MNTKGQIPADFEKLRDMEPFSEAMFNRIIAFQEKEHPAWTEALPFDQRIKDLPLHALVFSNPDRDPTTHAHTVAPYYPLRAEMRQIVGYARQVAEVPRIVDVHGRNGFLGSLLGREGARVVGLRDPADKPNQIERFFDPTCYLPSEQTLDEVDIDIDVAFSAWMPSGLNRTPQIVALRPKLIVFVHTHHIDETTGLPQTGTAEAYVDLPEHYKMIGDWTVQRPRDLFHEIWPDLTPSIEETREVKIYADQPYHGIAVPRPVTVAPYDWELELEMVATALRAKEHLRAQGFPV